MSLEKYVWFYLCPSRSVTPFFTQPLPWSGVLYPWLGTRATGHELKLLVALHSLEAQGKHFLTHWPVFFFNGTTLFNLLSFIWCWLNETKAADEKYRRHFLVASAILLWYNLTQHMFRLIATGHELKKLQTLVLLYQYMNMITYVGAYMFTKDSVWLVCCCHMFAFSAWHKFSVCDVIE